MTSKWWPLTFNCIRYFQCDDRFSIKKWFFPKHHIILSIGYLTQVMGIFHYQERSLAFLNQLFTFIGRWDQKQFPILCDGSSGDLNVLCVEEFGDLAVAKRLLWVFFRNQFFDQGADGC